MTAVAPVPMVPTEHGEAIFGEDGSLPESADTAVKMEPEAFSFEQRGYWRRCVGTRLCGAAVGTLHRCDWPSRHTFELV